MVKALLRLCTMGSDGYDPIGHYGDSDGHVPIGQIGNGLCLSGGVSQSCMVVVTLLVTDIMGISGDGHDGVRE